MAEEFSVPHVASVSAGPRRGRQTILLDDGRSFVFSDEACLRAGVRIGAEADEAYLQQLEVAEQRTEAHESALRLLSYRARSEQELRARLARRGVGGGVIDEEMERLRAAKLIDDDAFAGMWVQERALLAPRGRRLLQNELRAKGIAPGSIEDATAQLDDHAAALVLAQARAHKLRDATYDDFRKKVGGLLQRKGFDYGVIAAVLREVWGSRGDSNGEAV
ncbi:MAG: regulatory protein RecX [Tepidiformaceae bacterium]